ncbi:MAG: hypothetical protein JNJ88_00990 [Planctomycetes bacterium]|nr:hypothetical protein [Planctomycetota bacterium]
MDPSLEAWIAGLLLAAYSTTLVVVLVMPTKQRDPQIGQAIGCLMIVLLGLLGLGGALAVGIAWELGAVVHTIFLITVFPGVILLANAAYFSLRWLKRRFSPRG